jgi:hypothetical protein
VELFKKGLNNMMAGGGFTVLIPPLPKNPNSIYSGYHGRLSQGKPARCISAAEVLEIRDT